MSTGPSSSQTTQTQTKGFTFMHGDWNSNGGILHIVANELSQVIEGHTLLASHLGVLARDGNLAPLTYKSWHHVPNENKEKNWREIKVNFMRYNLFNALYLPIHIVKVSSCGCRLIRMQMSL